MADYEDYGNKMCPECGNPMLTKWSDSPATSFTFEACPFCGYAVGSASNVELSREDIWKSILEHYGCKSREEFMISLSGKRDMPEILNGRIVTLVRECRYDDESYINTFLVSENVTSPENAMRQAVADYLSTDAGKKDIERAYNEFNWGDAIMSVPDEIWEKHGLRLCRGKTAVTVRVYQDETLCSDFLND